MARGGGPLFRSLRRSPLLEALGIEATARSRDPDRGTVRISEHTVDCQ
jgi:hypothetical protein